jgi:hypothetical protein
MPFDGLVRDHGGYDDKPSRRTQILIGIWATLGLCGVTAFIWLFGFWMFFWMWVGLSVPASLLCGIAVYKCK